MKNIAIYRHQLLQPSEGFILQQTKYLQDSKPVFVGRTITSGPHQNIQYKIIGNDKLALARHVLWRDPSKLAQLLKDENISLIHAHFGVEGVYALPLAKKMGLPLITTFHGFDATCSTRTLLLSRKISWINYLFHRKQLMQTGDAFICVSDFIRNKLIQLGFPENKLIKHYIGIDVDTIKPGTHDNTNRIILHVARLVEKKGTEYLIRAFANINPSKYQAKLIIIGDGPLKHELEQLCKTLELQEHVVFLGVQTPETVIEWMQKATIFCLPSIEATSGDSEGLGMVFLEASACGLPIIATKHGGIPEAVIDNQTGLLVGERNASQITERLLYLLENQNFCKSLGLAGRNFVENNFSLKKQTKILESIYARYTR